MIVLMDTSAVIAAERRRIGIADLVPLDSEPAVSVITIVELRRGVEGADEWRRVREREAFIDGLLSHSTVVDVTLEVAKHAAQVWARQDAAGFPLSPFDTLIAATALAHGWPLVTADEDFRRVDGLKILDAELP